MADNKNQAQPDVNEQIKVRMDKLAALQEAGKDPFQITKYDVTHHTDEIRAIYEAIQDDNTDSDAVKMESTVVLHDVEFDEDIEYVIVGSSEADGLNNKISNESPLGAAMLGKKVGDIVKVEAPIGVVEYKIVSVKND